MSTQEYDTPGKRLKQARKLQRYSQSQLADRLGVQQTTISSWESGRTKIDMDYLNTICSLLNVDMSWILGGEHDGSTNIHDAAPVTRTANDWSEFVQIPKFNMRVSAGHGSIIAEENIEKYLAFRKDSLHKINVPIRQAAFFEVYGDSHYPELRSGDLVLVDLSVNLLSADDMYIIRIDDDIFIKYIQRLPNNRIRLSSSNSQYLPIEVSLAESSVQVIGQVVGDQRMRRFNS